MASSKKLYRELKQGLSIKTLTIPPPTRRIFGPAKREVRKIVHAEIQLLLHHDLVQPAHERPRYIGVSNFMCHAFFVHHGGYCIPKSHGEVPKVWSMPDDMDYRARDLETLSNAMAVTAKTASKVLRKAEGTNRRLGPLAQSVIDSVAGSLRMALTSTMRESTVRRSSCEAGSRTFQTRCDPNLQSRSSSPRTASMQQNFPHSSVQSTVSETTSRLCEIRSDGVIRTQWLDLHISFEDPESTPTSDASPGWDLVRPKQSKAPHVLCSVFHAETPASPDVRWLPFEQLSQHEPLLLQKSSNSDASVVVLEKDGEPPVRIKIRWSE